MKINFHNKKTKMMKKTLKQFVRYQSKKLFMISIVLTLIAACTKNAENGDRLDCSTPKSFLGDVMPLMQSSCSFDSDCHGAGSPSGPGPLLTYSEIFNARSAIRSAVVSGAMPKDAGLSSSEKNIILCWIDNGAQNN
jgi:hypothetical protein